ncbi:MAG TPA: VanW family protein [Candidatus Saccharimonadales bacterium]|nr:VanW family protein [Candidatus Saccharimonadales bacterium]
MARAKKSKDDSKTSEQPIAPIADAETLDADSGSDSDDAFADLGPKRTHHWLIAVSVGGIIAIASLVGFKVAYASKIYPGVSVNGTSVGGLTKAQAKTALDRASQTYQDEQVPISYGNTTLSVDISQIGISYDSDAAVAEAYAHGREGSLGDHLRQVARAITDRPTKLVHYSYDDAKLAPYVAEIVEKTDTPVVNATLNFSDTGRATVNPGQAGQRLDIGLLVRSLEQRIAASSAEAITAPIYQQSPNIETGDLESAKSQADVYLQGPITLAILNKTTLVQLSDIIKWISVDRPTPSLLAPNLTIDQVANYAPPVPVTLSVSDAAIAAYVAGLAKTTDKTGQNAALTIQDGHATVFQPSIVGYHMDQVGTASAIKAALVKLPSDRNIVVAVKTMDPAVTEANLNDLGINELIGEGVTYFPGSPAARMQNIRVGAAKFNGVLVKPDEVFSFESNLGDVGPATGYAPALVILGDHEEFQYGGGMCQVSSTAYRAALFSGLPIVERHNHSFAVGYYTAPYGVPGVDATVFNASIDLKFKNDTGHYILIQTVLSGTTLKFDFYGTKVKTGRIRGPYFIDPAGGAGWNPTVPSTTVFYRDILDLAGNVIKTDTIQTHYKSSLDFPVVKELN